MKKTRHSPLALGAAGQAVWDLALNLVLPLSPATLLETAAGGGYLAAQLKSRGIDVTGVDLVDRWEFPDIPFVCADLDDKLPFGSNTFDVAMIIEAISYLENPSHHIRELQRVVRPGGAVVLTMPNILCLQSRLRFLFKGTYRWFPHALYQGEDKPAQTNIYREPIRLTTMLIYLKREGLEVEHVVFGGKFAYVLLAPVALLLQGLLWLHNARGAGKKLAPPIVNSFEALFYTHVGIVSRKQSRQPETTTSGAKRSPNRLVVAGNELLK